jgi:hypothetical protein
MSNEDLIQAPEETMALLAQGIGHFLRLALAGYVEQHPELRHRMSELLNSHDEAATLTARLSEDDLFLAVGVLARDMPAPKTIASMTVALPPLIADHH